MLSISALRESFAYLPRTLATAWQASRSFVLALQALTLVSAGLPVAVAYTGKTIIDAVVAGDRAAALRRVGVELALITAQAAVRRGLGLLQTLLGARLAVSINVLILEKAQTLELRHFEDAEFYDQLVRARREASSRPVSVVINTFDLLQSVLTLGGYIALLVSYSVWAVAALFVAAVPATLTEMYLSTATFHLRNRRSAETRKLNYVEHVLANDTYAKEVMIFKLGSHLLKRYKDMGEQLYAEDSRLAVRRAGLAYLLSLLGTGAFYGCYTLMVVAAAAGRLTLGNLTLFVVALRQGQQAFQASLSAIGGMYESNLYMSNLFNFLDIAVTKRTPATALAGATAPAAAAHSELGIRFDEVSFRYPGQDGWVLSRINLFIPRGQALALVGHNGAGKTSLIKLLTRLYQPVSGRILLDGIDLEHWDEAALRGRFGVVFQDFSRYQFSFGENVGFGSVDHLDEVARITAATDRAGAAELLSSLPQGLATPLGRWFQAGRELSGGQWQKVALARAFMREEADILILDEPTAALDAEAEHAVFERFRALTRGRTAILISHRFPTVRMADRILVLEQGAVLEDGTHAELLARGGRYAALFALQARGYEPVASP